MATNRRRITWALAAAAVLVAAVGYAVTDRTSRQNELQSLKTSLKVKAAEVKVAQVNQDRLNFVRAWSPANPRALACLRDITKLFPEQGTIYATSVSFEAVPIDKGPAAGPAANAPQQLKYIGTLTGVASSQGGHGPVRSDANDTKTFGELKTGAMSEKGRNNSDVTFSFSFVYRGTE